MRFFGAYAFQLHVVFVLNQPCIRRILKGPPVAARYSVHDVDESSKSPRRPNDGDHRRFVVRGSLVDISKNRPSKSSDW